jgi:rfaE bifunctional protein nucleotidyltransferase chain/domain
MLTGHGLEFLEEARKQKPEYVSAEFKRAVEFILLNEDNKITDIKTIQKHIKNLKNKKKKIVTLNGTFDILHKGHDYMVSEAKKQGDILIVGVNSDSSVKLNKGDNRPINSENSRAKMIASYKEVDYVTIFKEKTPIEMLEIIRPDVHVNGSEYGESCIESHIVKKNGGKIHIVTFLPGYSSTMILNGKS